MPKRYHVVAITTQGYSRLASYETFDQARADALGRQMVSHAIVLRDGTTGKRYSLYELARAA